MEILKHPILIGRTNDRKQPVHLSVVVVVRQYSYVMWFHIREIKLKLINHLYVHTFIFLNMGWHLHLPAQLRG